VKLAEAARPAGSVAVNTMLSDPLQFASGVKVTLPSVSIRTWM